MSSRAQRGICSFLLTTAFWLLTSCLFAETTGDLRPAADGATEQWTNNAATSCGSATCYTEVNESSGANCSTTPGDSTWNKGPATTNQAQTYDIDESSIPNNSTVTSAVVRGCLVRGGGTNANGRFKFVINGAVTNCASNFTTSSTPTDFSCTIDFADDTKDGTDDYEIGVETMQARALWLTAIEVDITYTPPVTAQAPLRRVIRLE